VRWYYELSKNADFLTTLKDLIDIDFKCEDIIGDFLKRDQLKFLYTSARAFYDSPVKVKLLPPEEQGTAAVDFIKNELVPRLTAFRTIVYMHDIDRRKKKDLEEAEKLKAEAAKTEQKKEEVPAEEPQEEVEEKKEEEEVDEETLELQKKEEKKKKQDEEDLKYGRYMIWEGIVHEQRYEEWKAAADKIDGLNPHIIEDIQDFIIKQSYKPEVEKGKKELMVVAEKLQEEQMVKLGSEKEEEKKLAKVEVRLEKYRPDKRVWNFFLEKESAYLREHKFRYKRVHMLYRINANPFGIYEDGRVEKLWDDMKALEFHLKSFKEPEWSKLVKHVMEILRDDLNEDEKKAAQLAEEELL